MPFGSPFLLRSVLAAFYAVWTSACPAADDYRAGAETDSDLWADTWVATDAANRSLPDFNVCGPPRKERWVGIFYWTWHRPQTGGPNDNTKLLAAVTNAAVLWPTNGAPYHW